MRLSCPNCAAEYEVPDSVLPVGGRDLQCSNCGHTWFFKPTQNPTPKVEVDPTTRVEKNRKAPVDDVPPPAAVAKDVTPPDPPRKPMDPALAEILRQEADREMSARQAEGRAPVEELQEELGLPDTPPPQHPIPPSAAPRPPVRDTDRFPDINQINATLAPSATAAERVDQDHKVRCNTWRGFRWGLSLVLIIAIIMLLLYAYPNSVSELFPGIKEELAAYVVWVDGLRFWLDGQFNSLLSSMRAAATPDPS